MAVHAWPRNLHFLVSFFLLVSSPLTVRCLEQFYGTCGSTYDLMQTNTQSAILKVDMPSDMKMYQDPTRDIKCDIILTFTHGMNLLIDLYYVDIIPLSNDRKSCPTGLEIFDQTGRKYFGSRICMEAWEWEEKHQQAAYKPLVVESSPLTFRLVSDGPYKGQGFRVHLNQFRPYWPCYTREFRCEQVQRCVHDDLTCDGWDDCGDFSDERVNAGCHLLTPSEICGIIIGAILLIATGVVTVWFVITYSRLSKEFGLKISESKMPIALNESKASIDPSLTFPRRYNSKESLSKMSRSTAPTAANKYYSNNSLDKAELEKAERMTNDNMSERSYRSNPKKALNNTNQNDVSAEPIQKTGQYSARRGRNASQTSLNREKGNPPIENGQEKERRSQEKDDSDDDRRRRRSRDRSPRRDRYYSDDDSDYDYYRGRRHRRRSYDRYSDDDSEYERESRRRSRDRYRGRYDDDSDQDSDRAYRRRDSRERDRYRDDDRGRDSRDRDRYRDEDRGLPDKSRDRDDDKGPREKSRDRDDDRRRDSRERDRYRDEDNERRSPPDDKRRSPDDDYDDDRRRRHRRSRSGDRKRDSYDDDDRRRNRGRSPDRRRNYSPPPYPGQKENVGPGDDAPLPPPPSGEEIHRMELAKQLADQAKSAGQPSKAKLDSAQKPKEEIPKIPDLPKYEPQKSVTEVQKREQPRLESEPSRSSKAPSRQSHEPSKRQNDPPKQTYDPPKQSYDPPKQTYDPPKQTYDPPKQTYDPLKQPSAPIHDSSEQLKAVSDPPKSRWEPPAKKREPQRQPPEPIDENVRRRNTTDRRERYSKNRWTPKENNRSQESPPPEYEDVSLPPTTNIKINYREESV